MKTSIYIARLMGPLLLVMGIGMAGGLWAHPEIYTGVLKDFIAAPGFVFVVGMLALVAGLAIVNAHNIWVADWRVIITLLGWLALIRGVISLLFPLRLHALGERMVAAPSGPLVGAVVTIVLGAILCIKGYEALWTETPARQAPARRSTPKRAARKARGRARPRRRAR